MMWRMILGEGFFGFVMLAVWIYALVDVISTESFLCRGLPKMGWLFLVLVLPDIGAIAWFILGRPLGAGWRPGDTAIRAPRRVLGFEDSDDWTSSRSHSVPNQQRITPPKSATPPVPPTAAGPPIAESAAVQGAPVDGVGGRVEAA